VAISKFRGKEQILQLGSKFCGPRKTVSPFDNVANLWKMHRVIHTRRARDRGRHCDCQQLVHCPRQSTAYRCPRRGTQDTDSARGSQTYCTSHICSQLSVSWNSAPYTAGFAITNKTSLHHTILLPHCVSKNWTTFISWITCPWNTGRFW